MRAVLILVMVALSATNAALAEPGAAVSARAAIVPSNAAPIRISTSTGDVMVHEALRDDALPKDDPNRVYLVAPRFCIAASPEGILDVSVRHYSRFSEVHFRLCVEYPDLAEVLQGLRRVNRNLRPSNVGRLVYQDLRVDHPLFEPKLSFASGNASDIALAGPVLGISLKSKGATRLDVDRFVEAFRSGEASPEISCLMRSAREAVRTGTITMDEVASSKTFQDYARLGKDRVVTASQLARLSMEIAREVRVNLWDEFDRGDETAFLAQTNDLFRTFAANAKETWVDINTLRDRIAPYEINVNSDSFQPNVLKRFVLDVKNMSTQDFESKYGSQIENHFLQQRKGGWSGGGGFNYGLFGGSASASKDWNNLDSNDAVNVLNTHDHFHDEFDRSFRIEKEGTIYERIEARVYQDVVARITNKTSFSVNGIRVTQSEGWVPLQLDARNACSVRLSTLVR